MAWRGAVLALWGFASLSEGGERLVAHTVRSGETLSSIAQKYYGDSREWARIAHANDLQNPDCLREGQRLVIPMPMDDEPGDPPLSAANPDRGAAPVPSRLSHQPLQPSDRGPVPLASDALRRLAAAAIAKTYTNLNLAAYDPGYLVRLEPPTRDAGGRVVVSWLGREALALERGAKPEMDRKQVRKIEVWMTEDGRVLKIDDRPVWLLRRAAGTAPAP